MSGPDDQKPDEPGKPSVNQMHERLAAEVDAIVGAPGDDIAGKPGSTAPPDPAAAAMPLPETPTDAPGPSKDRADARALAAVRDAIIESREAKPRRVGTDRNDTANGAAPTVSLRALASRDQQMRFLAQSAMLEEAGTPRLQRAAMFAVSGLVACAIAWAAVTKVDEVAVGPGQILPSSRVQVIQHLEGGIVHEILVRDGALVKKGQVLLRLDRAASMAELDQEQAKETILSLQADRLAAFAGGKGWKPLKLTGRLARYRHLVADQLALLAQQRREHMSRRVVIQSQIRQREAELIVLAKTEMSLARQLAIVRESFQMRQRLLKQGITSRANYLEIKRDLERTTGEFDAVHARSGKARAELLEANQKLEELAQRLRGEALAQRGKITAELAQVREKLKRLQDRVTRLEIRAPVRGYVKGLKVNTVRGVIQPGQPIMEVVPVDRNLIVESRIATRDVGHLQIGQRAKVKIDTYDFARYGAVLGTIESISATTFQDDNGRPYYKGIIKLDRTYAGHNPKANPITPGMTVQVEVITGSKSVLAYLMKPITTTIQSGFRER
jgi:HlyD family secretion protein/adhesin transport system membrane fusion protein